VDTFTAVTKEKAARWARVGVRLGLLACVGLLGACGDHSRADELDALVPHEPGDLDRTAWVLVATGDSDAVAANLRSTLNIENGTASGTGPCNNYNVTFAVDGTDLDTGEVASTKQACPARVMRAEDRFFRTLAAVDTVEMEDDRLVLSGPHDTRLVFARPDDVDDDAEGS
jgi:heat shock protein HslJ